jgi:hypothetical protein
MTTVSYLISVTTSQNDAEVTLAILNLAGKGQAFYGQTDDSGSTDLWIIPDSRKNRQELTTHLQAVPAIRSVSIVPLSKPIKEAEFAEVRELFAEIGWDASDVTDQELSSFINDKLEGKYTYYIDHDPRKNGKVPAKIRVRPLTQHPHFSPDWLKKSDDAKDDIEDRELKIDDIEIREVTITRQVANEPPPPPPPPPHGLHKMTDEQIRQWMRKKDSRPLKNEDIDVKRTPEEILITIKFGGQTERIGYGLGTF